MIRIDLYEDGRTIVHKNENPDDYEGWLQNNSTGRYWCGSDEGNYDAILLNGNKKEYHLKQIVASLIKNLDEQISWLNARKMHINALLQEDLNE